MIRYMINIVTRWKMVNDKRRTCMTDQAEDVLDSSPVLAGVEMSHKTGGLCKDKTVHSMLVDHAKREENEVRTLTR